MARSLRLIAASIKFTKTPLIILLILLSIYQTGQLWVISITNRDFLNIFGIGAISDAELYRSFICPYRAAAGSEGGPFYVTYDLADTEEAAYFDSVIENVLTGGIFVGRRDGERHMALPGITLIYQFSFRIPSEYLTRAFNRRSNILASRGINYIDEIIIHPKDGRGNETSVFFLSEGSTYEYGLSEKNRPDLSEEMVRKVITTSQNEQTKLYATATGSIGTRFVLPPGSDFIYKTAEVSNPYQNSYNETLISFIQSRIEPMFSNPATVKQEIGVDGVFTFSDRNTVVRYTDLDILEYLSYRPVDRNAQSSLVANYAAAKSFIDSDIFILNDYYCSGYIIEGDRFVFLFDYSLGGLPVVYIEDRINPNRLSHAVEVTVEHGMVTRYRKLVYNFTVSGESAEFDGDYSSGDAFGEAGASIGYLTGNGQRIIPFRASDTSVTNSEAPELD